MDAKDNTHPVIHLRYRKGDLIMKEGDYGISIYKIKKGRVRVTQQQDEMELTLATLGPGEVFGEMAFLNKAVETRSASVRALEELELEVLHPARLTREYDGMPPILRYITNQTLNRLIRMNNMYAQLLKKKELAKTGRQKESEAASRKYYRKPLNQACVYHPAGPSGKIRLQGRLTDISVGGAGMEVSSRNAMNIRHELGSEFTIHSTLASGRDIELTGKIRSVKNSSPGRIQLGIQFTGLTGEATKTLGFFMMS